MSAPVLSYEGLGLIQGSGWLFRNLDLYIGERDQLALIGRNGAGKTTLLKLLANRIEADEGRRTIVPGTNVVLLEQEPKLEPRWVRVEAATTTAARELLVALLVAVAVAERECKRW